MTSPPATAWSITSVWTYFFGWLTGAGSTTARALPASKRSRAVKNVDKPAAAIRKPATASAPPAAAKKRIAKSSDSGKSSDKRRKTIGGDTSYRFEENSDEEDESADDYDFPPKKSSRKRPRAIPALKEAALKDDSVEPMEDVVPKRMTKKAQSVEPSPSLTNTSVGDGGSPGQSRLWKDIVKTELGIEKKLSGGSSAQGLRHRTREFLADRAGGDPEDKRTEMWIPAELVDEYVEFIGRHLPKGWAAGSAKEDGDSEVGKAAGAPKKKKKKPKQKDEYVEEDNDDNDDDDD
ncbi:hypothetical protein HDU93_000557 [Gonapodya sp. JEL0774]|nr:hypothetical protein HDU93_000557 [Gonapodya sp. JEL0774]